MPSVALYLILVPAAVAALVVALFLTYVVVKYSPVIRRIFEETPVFLPLRVAPTPGEDVRFPTPDGLTLAGTYFPARAGARAGVIVFCHEYLSDRWSVVPYADHLRDLGFDLFSFDFRNHGDSEVEAGYRPLQWVSDREVRDLRAALDYLRTRPDADPAGVGLFGISRGGGAALCVAADDPRAWAVVTDGAFPTQGTMVAYMLRWAEIYVGTGTFYHCLPLWMFKVVARTSRIGLERRRGTTYPSMERAVARLAPRPLLMIHGEKDAYIRPDIARAFFRQAGEPKELWIVPKAKHNRCREVEPEAYAARLAGFFGRSSPRRPSTTPKPAAAEAPAEKVAAPIAG